MFKCLYFVNYFERTFKNHILVFDIGEVQLGKCFLFCTGGVHDIESWALTSVLTCDCLRDGFRL